MNDSEFAITQISSSRELINVKIVGFRMVKESMFKSYTLFKIETRSNLMNLYDSDRVYIVERRFNDFKQLHEYLTSNPDYEGFGIPPLPQEA